MRTFLFAKQKIGNIKYDITKPANCQNLELLDKNFLNFLNTKNNDLYSILEEKRKIGQNLSSEEIIEVAKILDDFLIDLFNLGQKADEIYESYREPKIQAWIKRNVIIKIASKKYSSEQAKNFANIIDVSTLVGCYNVITLQHTFWFEEQFCDLLRLSMEGKFFDES
jgi:hypothetical protein